MSKDGITKYGKEDYEWVKKQISLQGQKGITRRELEVISKKGGKRLLHAPRWEKPPGRDKIIQILSDRVSIDWDYNKSKGGRGKRAVYIIKIEDPTVLLEKTVNYVAYQELTERLKTLSRKRDTKFDVHDYFELVRIRNQLLSYPMKIYHYGITGKGLNKDFIFDSMVLSVKKQLERLKIIEKSQQRLNKNFSEIVKNIEALNNSNIDLIMVEPKSDSKEYHTYKNALRRLLGIKT